MRIFKRLTGACHALVRRKRADAQLDEELSEYLSASIDAKVACGLSHAEARRQALAEFGSTAAVKEWLRYFTRRYTSFSSRTVPSARFRSER